MGLTSLVAYVSEYFAARQVPATAVYGQRARPAQGNSMPGRIGGRVSFLWTGKGSYKGPSWWGARPHEDTISPSGLVTLANDVAEARVGHYALGPSVHLAGAAPVAWEPATNLIEALDLGNWLRDLDLAHAADLTRHGAADTVNVVTAPAASSAATLRTLLLDLQAKGAAHNDTLGTVHGAADEQHESVAKDPLSTSATSRAIRQFLPEIEVEVWAWDDGAPTDDARQWAAWLSLHEVFLNACRGYARGYHTPLRTEPATKTVHVVRGMASLVYLELPIPVHELPAVTPVALQPDVAATLSIQQGTTPEGAPILPVEITVLPP
jgi:hypothetical protein